MSLYSFIGLDGQGRELRETIEAETEKDVARLLRNRSIFVLKVWEGGGAKPGNGFREWLARLKPLLRPGQYAPVGAGDLVIFFRQTAMMLRAGYTLVTALDASSEMTVKLRLRRTIKKMCDEIRKGGSFSGTLAGEKKIFTPMVSNLIASGEKSGNLDDILDRLADSIERSKDIKRQLVAAMFYPLFVLLVSIGVVIFLVLGVIPRFATFLNARNAALPASTQVLMNISAWAQDYGRILAIALGAVFFSLFAAYTTRKGKQFLDRVLLTLPLVGKAILFASMAQAGWCLAMLLRSGVTALESIRIAASVMGNSAVSDCFSAAADGLLQGQPLSKTLDQPHIPLMMRHMAAVGESSGQLDTVMHGAGEYYQKELTARVKLISVAIEPMLILMVGVVVGFVYFAFFQAVMSVSKGGM